MLRIIGIIAALAAGGAAFAQDEPEPAPRPQVGAGVAATVNDNPISTFDVQQRVRLMVATAGQQLPPEAIQQMQAQALRDLIEEQLKLSEADRLEFEIPEEEIDEELARIAQSGGGTVEALASDLAQQGISIDSLRDRIRADRTWDALVQGRYRGRVNVSEDEIEAKLAELRAGTQEEQFLLSEICLPVPDSAQAEQVYGIGMQMIDQMRQGAPFRALAQQYSACPSAARGGDKGWMRRADMRPEVADVVERLGEGNVSTPIPSDDMLMLIAVRQKRQAAEAGEPSYEVAYAGAPTSIGREVAEAAFAKLKLANPCNGSELSLDLGPQVGVVALPMLPASQFEPEFRPVLAELERGQQSDIVETDGAYHAVLMCARDEGLGLPSRQQVENALFADAMDRVSRRYLRDVERDSAVEVRLGTDG